MRIPSYVPSLMHRLGGMTGAGPLLCRALRFSSWGSLCCSRLPRPRALCGQSIDRSGCWFRICMALGKTRIWKARWDAVPSTNNCAVGKKK